MKKLIIFFIALSFSNNAISDKAISDDGIDKLIDAARKICIAPDQYGEVFEVTGEGDVGIKFKIFGSGISGDLTKKEEDGVREILKEQQHDENKNYRECAQKIFGIIYPKSDIPKSQEELPDKPIDCFSKNIDVSKESNLSKVIDCYQQEINSLKGGVGGVPLPDPGNIIEKNGVSVKFNECSPSKDHKSIWCALNIFSSKKVEIELYSSGHDLIPHFIDKNDNSFTSNCLSVNRVNCNRTSNYVNKIILFENRPITIDYRHGKATGDLKAYYLNIGFYGDLHDYSFLISN